MGEIILRTTVPAETGFLYYCSRDKKTGFLSIGKSKMQRGGRKKKSKAK